MSIPISAVAWYQPVLSGVERVTLLGFLAASQGDAHVGEADMRRSPAVVAVPVGRAMAVASTRLTTARLAGSRRTLSATAGLSSRATNHHEKLLTGATSGA